MARGPVNSLNTSFIRELTETIDTLEKDPGVKGMILTSSCKKVWLLISK